MVNFLQRLSQAQRSASYMRNRATNSYDCASRDETTLNQSHLWAAEFHLSRPNDRHQLCVCSIHFNTQNTLLQ